MSLPKYICVLLLLIVLGLESFTQIIVLEGHYRGKNIFIQNPFSEIGGNSFCIDSIKVNDTTIPYKANSAIMIRLDSLKLEIGKKIKISIYHKLDCKPKVLNNHVSNPKSTTEYSTIKLDSSGLLTWATTKESFKLIFIVEQFKWNKWVKIGEVDSKGMFNLNEYSFTAELNNGKNKIRLKQTDYSGKPRYSQSASAISSKPKIICKESLDQISFSYPTFFELYDDHGNIIKMGKSNFINLSALRRGNYYLNFGNQVKKMKIK